MRVLFVYKDYAPVVGGIENHIRLLAEGLQQRGVDVRVLVTNTGFCTRQEVIHGVSDQDGTPPQPVVCPY